MPQRLILGRKTYLLLEEFGGIRKRYRALDRYASRTAPVIRAIYRIPESRNTEQFIRVLRRFEQRGGYSGIPSIIEDHRINGYIYLVLPWVKGITLKKFIEENNQLPSPVESLRLIRGLAHSVSQLHQQNIIHGDLKPENLIVVQEPTKLVMIDFGSAWLIETAAYRELGDGISTGENTPYNAPELLRFYNENPDRLRELPPDFRIDVFSTSVIFYEMLTGKIPYDGMGGKAGTGPRMKAAFEEKYEPPSNLNPYGINKPNMFWSKFWKKVDYIISRGLKLDANNRYLSKREWLDDLDEVYSITKQKEKINSFDNLIIKPINYIINLIERIK